MRRAVLEAEAPLLRAVRLRGDGDEGVEGVGLVAERDAAPRKLDRALHLALGEGGGVRGRDGEETRHFRAWHRTEQRGRSVLCRARKRAGGRRGTRALQLRRRTGGRGAKRPVVPAGDDGRIRFGALLFCARSASAGVRQKLRLPEVAAAGGEGCLADADRFQHSVIGKAGLYGCGGRRGCRRKGQRKESRKGRFHDAFFI